MKSRKRLARDTFDTFAMSAGLVRDVADADYWAQNGSIGGRVFVTVSISFCNEWGRKSSGKLPCVVFLLFDSC